MIKNSLSPTIPINESGRTILLRQWHIIEKYWPILEDNHVKVVHEIRKAIRRSFVAYQLFTPFFQPDTFVPYRKQWRKVMRRLGRVRDATVFLQRLEEERPMLIEKEYHALQTYWAHREQQASIKLLQYTQKLPAEDWWRNYQQFLQTPYAQQHSQPTFVPTETRHIVPILIYQSLADVRTYESYLHELSLSELHNLRLEVKKLRYTLDFFRPLLNKPIGTVLSDLKMLQDVLGDLNDSKVAIETLEKMPNMDQKTLDYFHLHQEKSTVLQADFKTKWQTFNQPTWREKLGMALAIL